MKQWTSEHDRMVDEIERLRAAVEAARREREEWKAAADVSAEANSELIHADKRLRDLLESAVAECDRLRAERAMTEARLRAELADVQAQVDTLRAALEAAATIAMRVGTKSAAAEVTARKIADALRAHARAALAATSQGGGA